jgi:hypothetical protein
LSTLQKKNKLFAVLLTRIDRAVIRTVSVAGGGGAFTGLIVSEAGRVKPLNAPLIVAVVVALTGNEN